MHMHFFLTFCMFLHMCVFSRLCGGGPVGQYEAKPERIPQEDSLPGQSAAQPGEDLQPHQR